MSSTVKANIIVILVVGLLIAPDHAEDCVPRNFGYGSIVCVCNSTYCDSASVDVPDKGQYRSYESGQSGKRMSQEIGNFSNSIDEDNEVNVITLTLNPNETFQQIHGFGGAFTDAAGINIKKLSEGAQKNIIETYFGMNGSRYTLGRVPIGGTDFSTRPYTYDDRDDDVTISQFRLAMEDYEYKIPFMQQALKVNPNLRFFSAAWSAPAWMKSSDRINGYGFLKTENYQTFADYILKFLLEYKKHGLNMWAVSTGNEPDTNLVPIIRFNSMSWTPRTMATWVANNLGPTIAESESNETIILMLDDQRFNLPWYVTAVFNNTVAKNYIAGTAVHWYYDAFIGSYVLDATHNMFPDKFMIMTEACVENLCELDTKHKDYLKDAQALKSENSEPNSNTFRWNKNLKKMTHTKGSSPLDYPKVRLGSWNRAELYILDIMDNLNHWMTGWVDWNLVLDKQGGPNWVKNFVDSPIIVNPETDEFFKQPMYYALAHFSKFVPPGSTRIGITNSADVSTVAFLTPDDEIVIVLYNIDTEGKAITVADPEQGIISTTLAPVTIKTIIYKR